MAKYTLEEVSTKEGQQKIAEKITTLTEKAQTLKTDIAVAEKDVEKTVTTLKEMGIKEEDLEDIETICKATEEEISSECEKLNELISKYEN